MTKIEWFIFVLIMTILIVAAFTQVKPVDCMKIDPHPGIESWDKESDFYSTTAPVIVQSGEHTYYISPSTPSAGLVVYKIK